MDDYDFEEPKGSQIVTVFRDRERIGNKHVLATEIEGKGTLAKYLDRVNNMDPEIRFLNQLEIYYYDLNHYYKFSVGDLDIIIDYFNSTPNKIFKNPYCMLLGYILLRTYDSHKMGLVHRLLIEIKQEGVSEFDVIRYYRLLKSLPPPSNF